MIGELIFIPYSVDYCLWYSHHLRGIHKWRHENYGQCLNSLTPFLRTYALGLMLCCQEMPYPLPLFGWCHLCMTPEGSILANTHKLNPKLNPAPSVTKIGFLFGWYHLCMTPEGSILADAHNLDPKWILLLLLQKLDSQLTSYSLCHSSLHNIILNIFHVVLVLWSLLPTQMLSLFPTSCVHLQIGQSWSTNCKSRILKFRFKYYSSRVITPDSARYSYPSNSRIPSFFWVAKRGQNLFAEIWYKVKTFFRVTNVFF